MSKKECPSCAMEVEDKAAVCPICGYEFPQKNRGFIIVAIILLIVSLLYFVL